MATESQTSQVSEARGSVSAGAGATVDTAYQQGLVAGLLGALTIAVWFLVLDTLQGRPFYTPTVLGTALFRHGAGLAAPESLAVSLEMVALYTFVHVLVFGVIGGLASRLLFAAERSPSAGFGILLLFVVFESGFVGAALVLAEPVLRALAWPAILFGNLLAALVMGWYFWRKHPALTIRP